jgi:hypothetical protein
MNKDNMKQSKEISFWKPVKITTIRRGIAKPLFDYPNINTKSNYPKTILNINAPKNFMKPSSKKPVNVINTGKVKKKNMNWFQAKTKFPKLNPFGDADRDRVINMLDCKPFNKLQQDAKSKKYFEKFRKTARPLKEIPKLLTEKEKEMIKEGVEELYMQGKYNEALNKKTETESIKKQGRLTAKERKEFQGLKREELKEIPKSLINRGVEVELAPLELGNIKEKVNQETFNAIKANRLAELKRNIEIKNEQENIKEEIGRLKKLGTKRVLTDLEKQRLKRDIEISKEKGRIERRKLKTEEELAKTERMRIKADIKKRQGEEFMKLREGKAQVTLVRNIADIVRSSRRGGYRQEKWITGEESLRREQRERAKLKERFGEPEKIKIDPYERTRTKLREMEEREMAFITKPEKEKRERVSGGVIFDVPIKSPVKRFVEKITGRKTGAVAGEEILTNEYVSLPATKSQKETKEEKEILTRARDEELKMVKEEKKKEKEERVEKKEERIIEKEEKKAERKEKAEEKKTDEYGTPYEESAQKLIDEA